MLAYYIIPKQRSFFNHMMIGSTKARHTYMIVYDVIPPYGVYVPCTYNYSLMSTLSRENVVSLENVSIYQLVVIVLNSIQDV